MLFQLAQLTTVLLQDLLGARFFLPAAWDIFPAQERWNYHPLTPPFDLESGDATAAGRGADCMICLERIQFAGEKDVVDEEEPRDEDEKERLLDRFRRDATLATKSFSRFSYMVSTVIFRRQKAHPNE